MPCPYEDKDAACGRIGGERKKSGIQQGGHREPQSGETFDALLTYKIVVWVAASGGFKAPVLLGQ